VTGYTGFRDRRLSEGNIVICRLLGIRVFSVGKLVGKSAPVTREATDTSALARLTA